VYEIVQWRRERRVNNGERRGEGEKILKRKLIQRGKTFKN